VQDLECKSLGHFFLFFLIFLVHMPKGPVFWKQGPTAEVALGGQSHEMRRWLLGREGYGEEKFDEEKPLSFQTKTFAVCFCLVMWSCLGLVILIEHLPSAPGAVRSRVPDCRG